MKRIVKWFAIFLFVILVVIPFTKGCAGAWSQELERTQLPAISPTQII